MMRTILKSLTISIEASLVVFVTVSVLLGIFLSVQDSYGGYCGDGTCCISDLDCGGGCLNTRGICSRVIVYPMEWSYCNVDSDCPEDEWCVPGGNCVGGESDGEYCFAEVIGLCNYTSEFCGTDEDCEGPDATCGPPSQDQCPGGTCMAWPICPNCYIATATFGTELEGKTDILRSFRDEYLLNNTVGKAFVEAYYKYSPPIAHYIAQREWLKTVVRILLQPVIGLISLFV